MNGNDVKTVLLVDDDPIYSIVTKRKLKAEGYRVFTARTGKGALALIAEVPEIDLVLIDLDLGPGIDGKSAARAILQERALPIIFLTSHADEESREQLRGIPRHGCVSKDGGVGTLLIAMDVALELYEAEQRRGDELVELQRINTQLQQYLWRAPEAEAKDSVLVSNICDVIAVIDRKGINRYKSPNVERVLGWKPEELVGANTFENVHPEDRQDMQELLERLLKAPGLTAHGECRYRHHDGSYRWISILATNKSTNPAIDGVLLSYRDVTERHAAQEELEKTLEWFRSIFRQSPAGILLVDASKRIVEANPAAEKLLGYDAGELNGLSRHDVLYPEVQPRDPQAAIATAVQGEEGLYRMETRYRRKNGSPLQVSVHIKRIDLPGHQATHMVEFHDISRRKAAEQKVEALLREKEVLLQEVHHRVKNDMNFVHSLLSLQSNMTTNDELATSLREAGNRIAVMGHVYERLYRRGNVEDVNVGRLLRELVRDLRSSSLPLGIRVDLTAEDLEVETRLSVSLGVLVNELLTNAAKYAFAGISEPKITVTLRRVAGDELELIVRDNGKGLPEATIENSAPGYGLTIVNALVEQHSGSISLWNDGGGIIKVKLPISS